MIQCVCVILGNVPRLHSLPLHLLIGFCSIKQLRQFQSNSMEYKRELTTRKVSDRPSVRLDRRVICDKTKESSASILPIVYVDPNPQNWTDQVLPFHSTHFRSFRRRRGDCDINHCCRSQSTVDNSGVYMYYLKGIMSVCFRCPVRTVGFSGTRLYLFMYLHPTKLSDAQALPTSYRKVKN